MTIPNKPKSLPHLGWAKGRLHSVNLLRPAHLS